MLLNVAVRCKKKEAEPSLDGNWKPREVAGVLENGVDVTIGWTAFRLNIQGKNMRITNFDGTTLDLTFERIGSGIPFTIQLSNGQMFLNVRLGRESGKDFLFFQQEAPSDKVGVANRVFYLVRE
ncbi:MAG: hypothetical protein NZ551_05060 [Microscillaceae bacterium]|nr:hypothetical protein [Microscillaceae bacterium]MDW8460564.1 hypothetical protein [Cytophagales bacterium]